MSAALDETLFMESVEHAHEGNGLHVEPSCDFSLADALVAGNIEDHRRLTPGERQPCLPRLTVEAPLDQPRDIMHEKPKVAANPRLLLRRPVNPFHSRTRGQRLGL